MGTSIFAFIVVLGVLIFFHELGHFIVARLFGVGVEKFSLGFGPRLVGRKVGITDYRISAIPLGGYVKMVGEEPDAKIDPADIPLSFTHKSVGKRMLIVAAGPVFNIILAILIFFAFFSITGIEDIKPVIRSVEKNSVGDQAGLRDNDRIVRIDNQKVDSWYEINQIVAASEGKTLNFEVIRNQEVYITDITPKLKQGKDIFNDETSFFDIGISGYATLKAIIGGVSDGFPVDLAGLKKDDRIVSINDTPIEDWMEMQTIISSSKGKKLSIGIDRNGDNLTVEIIPKLITEKNLLGEKVERFIIGISAPPFTVPEEDQMIKRLNPIKAVKESVGRTYFIAVLTVKGVAKMIDGSIPKDNLGGPIMIAQLAGEQAKRGIDQLIQFIAFISINLAMINLLPIPVLDGGHLLFFGLEAVRGKPVNIRVREIAQQAGMFVLIMLMIFVFYNDITRLFNP